MDFDERRQRDRHDPVNVSWLMERDGELRITWPDGHVSHDDPASFSLGRLTHGGISREQLLEPRAQESPRTPESPRGEHPLPRQLVHRRHRHPQ